MTLQFFEPTDNGGSDIISYQLYVNDGTASNEPTTLVATYTSPYLMTHTITTATDGLVSGKVYKFKFEATNELGNSESSPVSEYALCDTPSAPGAPTLLTAMTT